MKANKKYYFLLPEKLVEELPFLLLHLSHIPGFSEANVKEIVSIICFHQHKEEDGFWTALKASYLRKYVPHAELYLNELYTQGVIEKSSYYVAGKTCYSYRISPSYRGRFVRLPLDNAKLRLRIDKAQPSLAKHNSKKYPNQNVYIRQLMINPKAYEFIETNYTHNPNQFNYACASATRIDMQDYYYTVDSTSHRYHSNLTNMPKELRQFVTVNGVPLVNVDVKNSQPYISTLILTDPKKIADFAKYPPLANLLQNLWVKQTEDVQKYISLVVEGKLYEYLMTEFEKRGYSFKTTVYEEKRDIVKKLVLQILFDRNVHMSRHRRIFEELFPEVHRIFSLVRGDEQGDKFKSYERFAILLQTVESHVILNVILKRINTEHPQIIAVTIHDSIMTAIYTNHIRIVKGIMEQEFLKFVGHKPTIKVE